MNLFQKIVYRHNIRKIEKLSFMECLDRTEKVLSYLDEYKCGNFYMKGCGYLTEQETEKLVTLTEKIETNTAANAYTMDNLSVNNLKGNKKKN